MTERKMGAGMGESERCPNCGGELEYDEVDIGVGTLQGNPGCPSCHWTPPEPGVSEPPAGPTRDEELACHDCREFRALWAAKLHAAEERARRTEEKLAEAAMEINCAGPVAHRIRVMRREYIEKLEVVEHENAALTERLSKLEKALEHAQHEVCHPCDNTVRRIRQAALAPAEDAQKSKG
jgi:hypothetical protein